MPKKHPASTLRVFQTGAFILAVEGFMSRFISGISQVCILSALLILSACSKGVSTSVVTDVVPSSVNLCPPNVVTCSPGLNLSVEVGQTQGTLATARDGTGAIVTETFSFLSSNPAVLTIAGDGTICAGTWNSLTTPQVCTPGPSGVAQVTAVTQGVSSSPVTVFVHQHVTRITVGKVPNQPATLSPTCYSKGAPSGPESVIYQAFAFNGSADITSSVGPFSWQPVLIAGQTTSAVSLSSPPVGSPLNQEIATASAPGITPFFASAGGFNSQPQPFETCPVQSISVSALGNPATAFVVNSGSSMTLNATVTDSLGMNLVGVPLTWNSSNPVSLSVSGATSNVFGSVGTTSAVASGGAAVIASCTPPSCNGGITPSLPIYPRVAINFTVRSGTAPSSPTVYVTSTGCGTTITGCTPTIVPLTRTSSTSPFAAGTPVSIPSAPNSFVFDARGLVGYLGVDSSAFGTQGIMTFTGNSANRISNIAGKVLAVSPDGTSSIISDTQDSPNQVFVCGGCNISTSHTTAAFLINGATAAAFSPDNLKAYIVAGSNLYVFSKTDPLQTISLAAPATDAAFTGNGTFGYLAGGDPAGSAFLPTCFDPALTTLPTGLNLPSQLIRPLPDGQSLLALDPPNVQTVTSTIGGVAAVGVPGCPAPLGFLSVNNTLGPISSLGLPKFTPTQFFVSPDGTAAYILAEVLPSQRSITNITAAAQSGTNTTYTYTLTSGPALQVGASIVITGMQNLTDNGVFVITALNPGTFTVANATGINAGGENGTGTVTPRFPFITVFNLQTQVPSFISLAGNATPLNASLSPAGDLLFVGADDGAVHVIDTATLADTQQITFPYPSNALCYGLGTPPTQAPVTCLPDLVVVRP